MSYRIRLPEPIPDVVTGEFIRPSFVRFVLDRDFEMVLEVELVYVDKDDKPILEKVAEDHTLTRDQRRRFESVFKTEVRTVSTRGAMVDPKTGTQQQPDEAGNYPEGSVQEKQLWLAVTADEAPGETVFEKVSAMLLKAMFNLKARGRY